jgi:hypothetical protein
MKGRWAYVFVRSRSRSGGGSSGWGRDPEELLVVLDAPDGDGVAGFLDEEERGRRRLGAEVRAYRVELGSG